jgi:transcriptional regulator with XRE-family HTH domain
VADPKDRRSTGSEKLGKLFKPPVVTKAALAASLNVSTQTVWAWIKGLARPSFDHMVEIQRRYGIDPSDWAQIPPAPQEASGSAAPPFPVDPVGDPTGGPRAA